MRALRARATGSPDNWPARNASDHVKISSEKTGSKPCCTPCNATSSCVLINRWIPSRVGPIGAVVSAVPLIARNGSNTLSRPAWSRPNAGKNDCPKYGTYPTAALICESNRTGLEASPSVVVKLAPPSSSTDSPPRLPPNAPMRLGSTRADHSGLVRNALSVASNSSGRNACIAIKSL